MARLPRLALAGHAHLVVQCAHTGLAAAGQRLFADEADRRTYREALFTAAAAEGVAVYAFALCDQAVWLLLSPGSSAGLGRLMQALGRRYVAAHHRRHGGKGTLWDGRYRAAVVEPGTWRLAALLWVDGAAGLPSTDGAVAAEAGRATGAVANANTNANANADADADPGPLTSASQRLGGRREPGLQDPPEWWPLGNTPFEREAAYRARLSQGLPGAQVGALRRATLGGWALGSAAFAEQVAQAVGRPARPRARGRPRKLSPTAT